MYLPSPISETIKFTGIYQEKNGKEAAVGEAPPAAVLYMGHRAFLAGSFLPETIIVRPSR